MIGHARRLLVFMLVASSCSLPVYRLRYLGSDQTNSIALGHTETRSAYTENRDGGNSVTVTDTIGSSDPPPHLGVWFAREIVLENGKQEAIEILYCPSQNLDYSRCRVGVVWVEGRHGLDVSSVRSDGPGGR